MEEEAALRDSKKRRATEKAPNWTDTFWEGLTLVTGGFVEVVMCVFWCD